MFVSSEPHDEYSSGSTPPQAQKKTADTNMCIILNSPLCMASNYELFYYTHFSVVGINKSEGINKTGSEKKRHRGHILAETGET
jgi:hypothetical protein